MDGESAVLAHWMPKGSQVYTLQCVVPGVQVIDETDDAKRHAKRNDLSQKIVQIYWEDFEAYAPLLMKHKGAPIHSIRRMPNLQSCAASKNRWI